MNNEVDETLAGPSQLLGGSRESGLIKFNGRREGSRDRSSRKRRPETSSARCVNLFGDNAELGRLSTRFSVTRVIDGFTVRREVFLLARPTDHRRQLMPRMTLPATRVNQRREKQLFVSFNAFLHNQPVCVN